MTDKLHPCPDCQQPTKLRWMVAQDLGWRFCPNCGWDEQRQLKQKMRDEMDNKPGP